MRLIFATMAIIACAGCATVNTASDYHGMGVEHGETPIETVEIENVGWFLFKFIPLGSGNPLAPNRCSSKLFQNTVTLQNNLEMLEDEMERVNATRVTNLTSRKTDESVLWILLSRVACHTSAVLLK